MNLSIDKRNAILSIVKTYVGAPYSKEFDCVAFVRGVYRQVGIEVPKLRSFEPPKDFNLSKEQLENPPAGHILFLKDREDPRKHRAWTHVVIILDDKNCIHCSLFFGRKVVVTPLVEIYKRYDYAESKTT